MTASSGRSVRLRDAGLVRSGPSTTPPPEGFVMPPSEVVSSALTGPHSSPERHCTVSAGRMSIRVADQLGEAASLHLFEGRAQALPVVGHDDDPVGAGGDARDLLEQAKHSVQALQRAQGLGSLRPGVVGDLVVVDEVDEDRRGAALSMCSATRAMLMSRSRALVMPRSSDVGAAAGHPRQDAAYPLAVALIELLDHLAHAEQQRAGQDEGAGEEADVGLRRAKSAPPGHPTHHEQGMSASPENMVLTATPPPASRPSPVLILASTSGGVGGPVGHHEPFELAVPPPEGDTPGRRCRGAARPGWPVWSEGTCAHQPVSVWLPLASQRATVGASPASMVRRSSVRETPSSWTTSRPGLRARRCRSWAPAAQPPMGSRDSLLPGTAAGDPAHRTESPAPISHRPAAMTAAAMISTSRAAGQPVVVTSGVSERAPVMMITWAAGRATARTPHCPARRGGAAAAAAARRPRTRAATHPRRAARLARSRRRPAAMPTPNPMAVVSSDHPASDRSRRTGRSPRRCAHRGASRSCIHAGRLSWERASSGGPCRAGSAPAERPLVQ